MYKLYDSLITRKHEIIVLLEKDKNNLELQTELIEVQNKIKKNVSKYLETKKTNKKEEVIKMDPKEELKKILKQKKAEYKSFIEERRELVQKRKQFVKLGNEKRNEIKELKNKIKQAE